MINMSTWNLNATPVEGGSISNLNATVEEERHNGGPNELNVTGLDTYSPTESPTTSPPSSSPSIAPSSFPSVSPSHVPSESPSNFPSVSPSLSPSVRPSLSINPSEYPSKLPSTSPSSAPSLPECFVDGSGLYGKETGNSLEVNYFYQVHLIPNTTSSQLEGDILYIIEEAIAKKVLPGLFQDTCGDFRRNRMVRQRFLQQSEISGISAQPTDSVFDEVLCQGSEIDCFVIDGRMTVYSSFLDSIEASILVKDVIRNSIENGDLDDGVDERIEYVQYLDDISRLPNANSNFGATERGGIDDDGRFPIWGMTVIASFGALFLLGGLLLLQRRRNSEADDDNDAINSEVNTEADLLPIVS